MDNYLKNIAKQWKSNSFNEFKAIYNNLKIVKPQDMVKLSKVKIAENEILIMATKKPKSSNKPPVWFTSYMSRFEKKIDQKIDNLDKRINARLDVIVRANNLIDSTLK